MKYDNNKRYYTMNQFLKERFGKKVFKVSLNAGFTCPNKDGTKGTGGCIFCSPSGSGDFAGDVKDDLRQQFESIKTMMHNKWPDAYYIPYFQANTNTYAPVGILRPLFEAALDFDENVVGLAIATRADALDENVLDLLEALGEKTYLQVELGLQSMHETTARMINRGHTLDAFDRAVKALRKRGINTVVHIINGLPGETEAMMLATAEYLNTLDIQGVKIHMLHIVQNTALAAMYEKDPFLLLSLDAYVRITTRQIELLDETIVIQRVTGDADKHTLIAPLWTLKKFVVMNAIDKLMKEKNTRQGVLAKR